MTGTSPSGIASVFTRSDPTYRFGPPYQPNGQLSGVALSVVRCIVSFLFACHGAKILLGVFGGIDEHGASAPVGSWPIDSNPTPHRDDRNREPPQAPSPGLA
jgi:hypothetical protein